MTREENYHKMIALHGTSEVSKGRLTGTTDTDYFYFLCPKCDGGRSRVMRIIDYGQLPSKPFKYAELKPKVLEAMQFSFELYCPECKTHTVVKLANDGLQGGSLGAPPEADAP